MPQVTIRFPQSRVGQIRDAARKRGFASPTALMRHAVEQELGAGDGAEQRIAATLDRIGVELARLHAEQQSMFAFLDALAKTVLSGLPEQAFSPAKGRERYDRFIRSAAAGLVNGPHPFLRGDVEP
jgi:Arc/MetJ-type ribon-helix-helix transcriptional regulator